MRRLSWLALVLMAVSLAPGVDAAVDEIHDTFYDCALQEIGWRILAHDVVTSSGAQSGAYRYREIYADDYTVYDAQWYAWNGTSWVPLEEEPEPSC